jgi:hypothetical protein
MTHRIPLVASIVFVVLFGIALVMVPTLPGPDQPGSAVVSHLAAHGELMRIQALLLTLGTLALVVVLGYARGRLDGPAGYVFTIGGAMVLAECSIELWFTAGLALHAHTIHPDVARAVADVASLFGPVLNAADVMVSVPIVLAAKAARFPRWLGIIAAIFAAEQFVELVTIIGPFGTFISPGGPMNLYLGGALFLVFFLMLGVALTRDGRASDR